MLPGLAFYMGAGNLNAGLYTGLAGTLPTASQRVILSWCATNGIVLECILKASTELKSLRYGDQKSIQWTGGEGTAQ